MATSTVPADDPPSLREWRAGRDANLERSARRACEHEDMRLIDTFFYWPGARSHAGAYPIVETTVSTGLSSNLERALTKPVARDYPSGGVWLDPAEASAALVEIPGLLSRLGNGAETDFVDIVRRLLAASVTTGNPVVTHYNGICDGAWE